MVLVATAFIVAILMIAKLEFLFPCSKGLYRCLQAVRFNPLPPSGPLDMIMGVTTVQPLLPIPGHAMAGETHPTAEPWGKSYTLAKPWPEGFLINFRPALCILRAVKGTPLGGIPARYGPAVVPRGRNGHIAHWVRMAVTIEYQLTPIMIPFLPFTYLPEGDNPSFSGLEWNCR